MHLTIEIILSKYVIYCKLFGYHRTMKISAVLQLESMETYFHVPFVIRTNLYFCKNLFVLV